VRWLFVLFALGCGDNVVGDPFELRDGTRLEHHYWVFDDGARQWDSSALRDRALAVDCSLRRWSDGHTYCTPEAGAIVYADGACEDPLGYSLRNTTPPAFFKRDYVFESETLPSRMYRRGAATRPTERFWAFANNACVGPYEDPNAELFEVAELDLARVKTTAALGDGRIRLTMLQSDDGMQAPGTLVDSQIDQPCVATELADGSRGCVPDAALVQYFRDSACSTPVVAFGRGTARSNVAVVDDSLGCSTYFAVGEEESKYPLFTRIADGSCVAIELPDSDLVFGLVPFEVPRLDAVETVHGRLSTFELRDGAMHAPAADLYDPQLESRCERAFADDTARCLPLVDAPAVARYYDADPCLTLVYVAQVNTATCHRRARFAAARSVTSGRIEIHRIAAPYAEPLYTQSTGQCRALELAPGMQPHRIENGIPYDTFVAARRE
jgi:hypothetical protein